MVASLFVVSTLVSSCAPQSGVKQEDSKKQEEEYKEEASEKFKEEVRKNYKQFFGEEEPLGYDLFKDIEGGFKEIDQILKDCCPETEKDNKEEDKENPIP